jgi:hypothetical protein
MTKKKVKIGEIFMSYHLKPMVIVASFSFFIHMNVKEFKPKNPFDKLLSLSFNLRPFNSLL